jgi:hypothetical protein
MQNAQALRSSFQQLVVGHQVQRPQANRNFRRGRQQQQRGGWAAAPSQGPASQPAGWPLSAVRADQATDATDTEAIQLISDITRAVHEVHAAALQRNAAAALEGLLAGSTSELKQKVQASILDLQSGLLERETEVRPVGWAGGWVQEAGGGLRGALRGGSCRNIEQQKQGAFSASHVTASAVALTRGSNPRRAGAPAAAGGAVRRAPAAAGPPGYRQV